MVCRLRFFVFDIRDFSDVNWVGVKVFGFVFVGVRLMIVGGSGCWLGLLCMKVFLLG